MGTTIFKRWIFFVMALNQKGIVGTAPGAPIPDPPDRVNIWLSVEQYAGHRYATNPQQ